MNANTAGNVSWHVTYETHSTKIRAAERSSMQNSFASSVSWSKVVLTIWSMVWKDGFSPNCSAFFDFSCCWPSTGLVGALSWVESFVETASECSGDSSDVRCLCLRLRVRRCRSWPGTASMASIGKLGRHSSSLSESVLLQLGVDKIGGVLLKFVPASSSVSSSVSLSLIGLCLFLSLSWGLPLGHYIKFGQCRQ